MKEFQFKRPSVKFVYDSVNHNHVDLHSLSNGKLRCAANKNMKELVVGPLIVLSYDATSVS